MCPLLDRMKIASLHVTAPHHQWLGPWASSGNWMTFPQVDFSFAAEGKGKWQPCSHRLQQVHGTWGSRLKVTVQKECSFTDQWEARTTFSAYIRVTKKNPKTVNIFLYTELGPFLMKAVKQSFPLLNLCATCKSPPVLQPLFPCSMIISS